MKSFKMDDLDDLQRALLKIASADDQYESMLKKYAAAWNCLSVTAFHNFRFTFPMLCLCR